MNFSEEDMEDDGNVTPERDDSILTFSKHTSALFCGNFSTDGSLAVTGKNMKKKL